MAASSATPVYDRYALAQGIRMAGPAIVGEREAPTIIPPGDSVTRDASGTLAIDIGLRRHARRAGHRPTPLEQAATLI